MPPPRTFHANIPEWTLANQLGRGPDLNQVVTRALTRPEGYHLSQQQVTQK